MSMCSQPRYRFSVVVIVIVSIVQSCVEHCFDMKPSEGAGSWSIAATSSAVPASIGRRVRMPRIRTFAMRIRARAV